MYYIDLIRKNISYYLRYFFLNILASSLTILAVNAQTNNNTTITGKIIDHVTKLPLEGATVHIKGTTHEAITNDHGVFTFITAQKLPLTFSVSSVGYQQAEQRFDEGDDIEIQLQSSTTKLNDVVIIGYGTQRKSDITGSVSSVPKENFNQVSSSVDNLLRGAAPGVQVTQSSGQPGASSSIRIRGGNSITGGNEPLYVIDGFPVYNENSVAATGAGSGAGVNTLSTINPSDIESIEILKDASATAIYGSRGANGVILITTKKGKKGSNDVTYQTYFGEQKITKTLPVLNATQWAQLRNDVLASINQPASFTPEQIAALGKGTDWQAAAFRRSPVQNHELSFSGGDDKSRYAIAGNYFNQKGILQNTDFKRYSLRFNYDRNISSLFKIGLNVSGSQSVFNGVASNSTFTNLLSPNIITNIISTSPVIALKDSSGNYNVKNPYAAIPSNPIQDLYITHDKTNVNRILGNFFGEYQLIQRLIAKVSVGADLLNTKQNYYAPSNTVNGYAVLGLASVGAKQAITWLNENTLTYDHVFNKDHSLTVLGGYSTQSSKVENVLAGSKNFITDANSYNSLQSGSQAITPASDAYEWTLNSYLARINYSYRHKYNFTLSGRADGSSRFGSGNKWGYFPSAGFSWNACQEGFVKNSKLISSLKFRVSAGQTGNQEIGQYLSLAALTTVNYNFNSVLITGFAPGRLSNKDLRWEKTTQYDVGIDAGLFSNRIDLVFDVYYKKTNDLLLSVPIPLSVGYSISLQNIGRVENKGIEIGLNTDNLRGAQVNWRSSIVFSINRNKVLDLGNNRTSFFPALPASVLGVLQPVNIIVGQSLGTFWGYKTSGIFQEKDDISKFATIDPANTKPGDRRYVDVNNDGRITSADKVILGSPQPKFSGSFTNTFSYKNFDLLVFLQGTYGNKIYNALRQQLEITNLSQNAWADVANRWTPANASNDVPRATNSPVAQMSDRYIEDGSYLRLKNIVLGYNFPKAVVSKIKAKALRIYISAQNLSTWTKYTGFDPEVNSFEQSNTAQSIDYGAYPNYKTFLAGLNLTF